MRLYCIFLLLPFFSCHKDVVTGYGGGAFANISGTPNDGSVSIVLFFCANTGSGTCLPEEDVRFNIYMSETNEHTGFKLVLEGITADNALITGLINTQIYYFKAEAFVGERFSIASRTIMLTPRKFTPPVLLTEVGPTFGISSQPEPGASTFASLSPDLKKVAYVNSGAVPVFGLINQNTGTTITHPGYLPLGLVWHPNSETVLVPQYTFPGGGLPFPRHFVQAYDVAMDSFTTLTDPQWSSYLFTYTHDGSEIAYLSNRELALNRSSSFWAMNADGTGHRRLSPGFELSDTIINGFSYPNNINGMAWSPDKTKLYFSLEGTKNKDDINGIYELDILGGNTQKILAPQNYYYVLSVAPNGYEIIFISYLSGNGGIWKLNTQTGMLLQLQNHEVIPVNTIFENSAVYWRDATHFAIKTYHFSKGTVYYELSVE